MPGKHSARHRAPQRPDTASRHHVPAWAIVAAVVVALIPAVWFGANRVFGDEGGPADEPSGTPIPAVSPSTTPSASPVGAPTGTPTPTPTPSPTPSTGPANGLPKVSEDAPRRLTSGSLIDTGFDDSIEPVNGVFTARSSSEVSRWGSRGLPGSPSKDTVFVVGDVNADGSGAFAKLPQLKPGKKIVIRTDEGTLTYTVRSVGSHPAAGISTDPAVVAKVPSTLVLLGVRYNTAGERTGNYVVVKADLTGAVG